MHLDTGSSDLWVNTPSSALCNQKSQPCAAAGTYTANDSSTYSYIGSWFNISYVDGSSAAGDYVSDTIKIGETTLEDFQFGIGYTSASQQGILGIGYPINEVQVGRARMEPYQNLPAKMVNAGLIRSTAYSLWLNDLDSNKGSILFGGVDNEQFVGTLQTVPIQANGGVFSEFKITLTSLTLGDKTIVEDKALAVLLDSGSSLSYLPDTWVEKIYSEVGAVYENGDGAAYVNCELANSPDTLDFTFSEPRISVEMNGLVINMVTPGGGRPTFTDGVEACLFGIVPAGAGSYVLGDTFLRSAYVVYDLDNDEISLAQTNFNATESDIKEIMGPGEVPGATKVASPVAATAGVAPGGSTNFGIGVTGAGGSEGTGDDDSAAPPMRAASVTLVAAFALGVCGFISTIA